jgi:hypothetical protein
MRDLRVHEYEFVVVVERVLLLELPQLEVEEWMTCPLWHMRVSNRIE